MNGSLRFWSLVALLLENDLVKKPSEEDRHLEERQKQEDEFSRKRWREKR